MMRCSLMCISRLECETGPCNQMALQLMFERQRSAAAQGKGEPVRSGGTTRRSGAVADQEGSAHCEEMNLRTRLMKLPRFASSSPLLRA